MAACPEALQDVMEIVQEYFSGYKLLTAQEAMAKIANTVGDSSGPNLFDVSDENFIASLPGSIR